MRRERKTMVRRMLVIRVKWLVLDVGELGGYVGEDVECGLLGMERGFI